MNAWNAWKVFENVTGSHVLLVILVKIVNESWQKTIFLGTDIRFITSVCFWLTLRVTQLEFEFSDTKKSNVRQLIGNIFQTIAAFF